MAGKAPHKKGVMVTLPGRWLLPSQMIHRTLGASLEPPSSCWHARTPLGVSRTYSLYSTLLSNSNGPASLPRRVGHCISDGHMNRTLPNTRKQSLMVNTCAGRSPSRISLQERRSIAIFGLPPVAAFAAQRQSLHGNLHAEHQRTHNLISQTRGGVRVTLLSKRLPPQLAL